jgi:tRNA A-37 threonylcarbamoyl transferase component Bud32/tetratricopeptide (TPR) repeat protein
MAQGEVDLDGLTAPDFERIRRLFAELCDLAPAEQRQVLEEQGLLDGPAGRVLGELLRGDREALEADPLPWRPPRPREALPATIGPYTVEGRLGQGASSIVYKVRPSADPTARPCALKLLRSSSLDGPFGARFEAEAAALSRLDHHGIPRLDDWGFATVEGLERPYVALELVEGCGFLERTRVLSLFERVALCAAVAETVGHAHHCGIVHRDLKPSNLLVRPGDRPVVLDFGLARFLDAGQSGWTREGDLVGTLEYMSPEQAAGRRERVDARSDVHALGAVFFEALTGERPRRLSGLSVPAAVHELLTQPPRRLREVDSELPRRLEAIASRCLARRPELRYPEAGALAADLRRWMAGAPLEARTRWLAAGRALRSWRGASWPLAAALSVLGAAAYSGRGAAALAGLAVLLGGLCLEGWRRSRRAVATVERAVRAAESAAAQSRAAFGFLDRLLGELAVAGAARPIQLAELLESAERRLSERQPAEPEVEAQLRALLGRTWRGLGNYERAERQLLQGLERVRRAEPPPAAAKSLLEGWLAIVLREQGRTAAALELQRQVLAEREQRLGPSAPETAAAQGQLALLLKAQGDPEGAERLLCTAVESLTRHPEREAGSLGIVLGNHGLVLDELGRVDEARNSLGRAVADLELELGPDHPETLAAGNNLAVVERRAGRPAEALARMQALWPSQERVLGAEHPWTLSLALNLGFAALDAGQLSLAQVWLTRSSESLRRRFPPEHILCLGADFAQVRLARAEGRFEEARTVQADLLARTRRVLPEGHRLRREIEATVSVE